MCFWVVLSCSVFVQKSFKNLLKPLKPEKKPLKTFFKPRFFSGPSAFCDATTTTTNSSSFRLGDGVTRRVNQSITHFFIDI